MTIGQFTFLIMMSILVGMLLYGTLWYHFVYLPTDSAKNTQIIQETVGNSHICDSHNCEADQSTLCGTNVEYFTWKNSTGFTRSVGFYPETCGV